MFEKNILKLPFDILSNDIFISSLLAYNIRDDIYNSFMKELDYKANVKYYSIDTNFAEGLAMFIKWAQDKDFILRPFCDNGNIIFEKLDKILKYCSVTEYYTEEKPYHTYEQLRFTRRVYLECDDAHGVWLYGYKDRPYYIGVHVTVDCFYDLVNKASLRQHGISIKEMQEKTDFEKLKEDFAYAGEPRHKFSRAEHRYVTNGNQSTWTFPFRSSPSGSSSSNGILDMGRKNLGNSGIGFGDYYGEY